MSWYRYDDANNLVLNLYVQPGAKNTVTAGFYGDALKIKLAAVPLEGKANAALVRFLAKYFDVPIAQVILKQGGQSRRKVVVIQHPGCDPDVLLSGFQD